MNGKCCRVLACFGFSAFLCAACVRAQPGTCGGLLSVDDSKATLVYPPIAKAAHVSGVVLLLAALDNDGSVTEVRAVSGPVMLQASAIAFVRAWKVNGYTGPRTCPIAISYVLDMIEGAPRPGTTTRGDAQHVEVGSGVPLIQYQSVAASIDTQHWAVHGSTPCLCDPSAEIHRRRRFGIF